MGSAIHRRLVGDGYVNIVTRSSSELDLTGRDETLRFFESTHPEYVFLCAAKVGGIKANSDFPGDFIYDNLMIQSNVITASMLWGVKRLMFLGSSCVYPKFAEQPISESSLMSGPPEETNKAYAIAKIAGIEMCRSYRKQFKMESVCVMPANLYGAECENWDPDTSHMIPAMIRKMHTAKISGDSMVTLWGTGSVSREVLHVDDCADACVFLMNRESEEDLVNIGCGYDYTIRELAEIVANVVGYRGNFFWDHTRPDGTPRKLLNCEKLSKMGWKPKIGLAGGLESAYRWYCSNVAT